MTKKHSVRCKWTVGTEHGDAQCTRLAAYWRTAGPCQSLCREHMSIVHKVPIIELLGHWEVVNVDKLTPGQRMLMSMCLANHWKAIQSKET